MGTLYSIWNATPLCHYATMSSTLQLKHSIFWSMPYTPRLGWYINIRKEEKIRDIEHKSLKILESNEFSVIVSTCRPYPISHINSDNNDNIGTMLFQCHRTYLRTQHSPAIFVRTTNTRSVEARRFPHFHDRSKLVIWPMI